MNWKWKWKRKGKGKGRRKRDPLLLLLLTAVACTRAPAPPSPPPPPSTSTPAPAPPAPPPQRIEPAPESEDDDDGADGERRSTETVTIKLTADARRQARVSWGRKDLGMAPLEIVRPRGSAPLDLLIVAPGCLPLHTRVFTDRNDTLALRLYSERDAAALPGYPRNGHTENPQRGPTPSPSTKPQR